MIDIEIPEIIKVRNKQFKVFITESDIEQRVLSISQRINTEFEGKNPLFIAVLNGAFMFAADLFKHISIDCGITFVKLASYDGLKSTGKVKSIIGLQEDIKDRHVIIIEDIVDSGVTLHEVENLLQSREPRSIQTAALLLKPDALQHNVEVDYIGFKVPNDFLLGYGLDYSGLGRNLPAVYRMMTSS